MKNILLFFIVFSIVFAVEVDPKLPKYRKVVGISGQLNSVGSDTLNNLMALWSEEFKKIYPNVIIQVEGKGSSTAPPALISKASQLAPMSRKMKSSEIDSFESRFGYKPTRIGVAIDALAVFVNKENPIIGLSLKQLDSVFSSSYNLGGSNIDEWTILLDDLLYFGQRISIYGRNSASGTYGYFRKVALGDGNYKRSVQEQPGSSAVVNSVAKDYFGIGYSGIGYKTSEVRVVPLSKKGNVYYEASPENCLSGNYPLARLLNIYINKKPDAYLDNLTLEFLRFVLSYEGQKIVVKDGYYPLPAVQAKKYLKALSQKH